ncbi:prohead protease/major capsid protein fusion protein [Xanthobacter versatilis]|uniref:prohead protease/major capsid protein fusion protein n=1 Tax=Xanthobacter autotrophicus (strain ATCC BAA-1158 / Py2) TaxID=78245 RepID=UPI003727B794
MNAPTEIITRRAPLPATSWNAEERTFEVVFSTGADVERYDARGAYIERLDLNQDWSAFVGAPVLNSHRRGDLTDVLGSVQKAWTVGGNREARAVVKLSRRADVEPIIQDILDGHLRGVSVGYAVHDWKETTEGARRVKTATRWSPVELSIVPIPADRQATIRGETMPAHTVPADPAGATPPQEIVSRAAPTPTASTDRAAVNSEIRSIATVAGLDQGWIDSQIDANASTEAARAAAFDAMRTRSAPAVQLRTATISVGVDHTDPMVRAAAIGEALYTRANPGHTPSERARAYVGLSIPEIARDCLRTRGLSVTGLGTAEVVTRALHSTSDFALALADTQGRVLATAYKAAASGLKPLARQVTLPDFRARTFIRTSGISDLEKVNEAGEFRRGTFGDAGESVRLETFGKVFGISRQALINDDTGALSDVPRKFGDAAARFEADQLAKLLASASGAGPTMADGKALFHAGHGNLAATGTAVDVSSLSNARLAMRAQTDDAGHLISVVPKYLVVGPAKETEADLIVSTISATTVDEANPFSNKLTPVVEPRLSGNRWYLVDPTVDGLIYAHLASEPGPQLESRAGFDVDGIETRIRLDFGCAFIDWRGWYRNPGN